MATPSPKFAAVQQIINWHTGVVRTVVRARRYMPTVGWRYDTLAMSDLPLEDVNFYRLYVPKENDGAVFEAPLPKPTPTLRKAKCALIAWPADFISALVARLQATDDYVLYPACRQLEQIAQVADEFYLWSNGQTLDSKVVRVHNEDATASNHGSEWFFRFPYFADLSYPCAVRPRNKGEGRKNISKIPDLKVSASGRTLESCHRSLSAAVIRAGLRPRLKRLDKVAAPVLPS